ncbi:hypothetical protein [Mycobacteroides abscessus]|uniref:hypothetical protein n=1 Tax=Mycobacteroides abscessus TaxID=36809 RepID=UPI0010557AC9|nr:hypothetical protein [Mycobacteroides abscessus]
MTLAAYRATREEYTLADRQALGQTIATDTPSGPIQLVHGRYLASEALAEYDALNNESDEVWRTVSPFRSDYDEIQDCLREDYVEICENLAYSIHKWLGDCEQEAKNRDRAICRAAELAMYDE